MPEIRQRDAEGRVVGRNVRLRFEEKYLPHPATGCWNWLGGLTSNGYSDFKIGDGRRSGHVFSYLVYCGPIPAGYEIDHLCHNRACVNPAHLEAVPHLVNVRRGNAGLKNRSKTHCKRGHPYDEANTQWRRGTNMRLCRICRRDACREQVRRNRAKRGA